MSEEEKARNAGKSGRRKVRKTSEVGTTKSEEESIAEAGSPGSENEDSFIDNPHSEIQNKSENENGEALNEANPKSEINMEVHHHPEVEKKGLKEYILEGLMIFLAVTMGFFAETIREGISDTAKGKDYIKSFVQDLRRDTATFSGVIAFDATKLIALNSIFACYDSIDNNNKSKGCLIPVIKSSVSNRVANFTDGTLQQLKNAGGFRLLNKSDRDSIVAYDHAARAFQNFESTIFQQRQDIVRNIYVKLINFKAETMLLPDSLAVSGNSPLLFSNDKAFINEYFNDLFLYRRVIMTQSAQLGGLSKRATGLIKYFNNKYDLE
jgi:hypothetical protein